jgi:copper transporter 1
MTATRLSASTQSSDDVADAKEIEVVESPVDSPTPVLHKQRGSRRARIVAPFIAVHDVPRGALYALQALLAYALMLAVM